MFNLLPRPGNEVVAMETNDLRSFLNASQTFLPGLVGINFLMTASESFFIPMATVVKVTRPQYFSCQLGLMAHLSAKFR